MYEVVWCAGFFLFKQKTAYEVRISDWSSDVCSSDLVARARGRSIDCARGNRDCGVVGMVGYHPVVDGAGTFLSPLLSSRKELVSDAGTKVEIGRASCRERVCQYV